ncbi:MAG TPA: carbon-nitrogen hydrolase family protein [bacterium]|nr:carbon-nitrogen hydrolase family protein [bacterium]
MKLNLALIQFEITQGSPETNWEHIEQFIVKAAEERAEVVVFPEDCITGSIFGDESKLDKDQVALRRWQELAAKYRIDIVTGSVMEGTPEGNFNTSYYVDFKGEVLGQYRKNHLYHSETFLTPGTEAKVFDTQFGKAAIVICWDMLFPEIFERLKSQGVQIIYCPSYWYREIAESMARQNDRSEEQLIDALCLVRAVETNAAVIYCNAAGTAKHENGSVDTLIGHSQIVMPVLGTIQELRHHHEKMFVAEIDLNNLKKAKKIYHGSPHAQATDEV